MWITILSDNFKELLKIFTIKPIIIIALALMFLAGFFINKWSVGKDDCYEELKARDKEINAVRDSMYNYKYNAVYYRQLYEKNKNETDSVFKQTKEVLKPLIESNTK